MAEYVDHVPDDVVGKIRAVCLALPEACEEPAWIGTRWRIRNRTFAHVVNVAHGWPPAYVRAVGSDGPAIVLTFEASGSELEMLSRAGRPFFKPPWRRTVVGVELDDSTDWDELAELLTDSYCALAPKRLADLVERPSD